MTADHQFTVQTIVNGDAALPVEFSGPADGPTVLLLHGWPQNARSWDRVVPRLHTAGFRTVVPSLRGAAVGAAPRSRLAYRPDHLGADVSAIMDEIGEPVHLVGHDWGAALAWTVACRTPERLLTMTAVSVPHPTTFLHAVMTSPQSLRSWYMLFFQIPILPEFILRRRSLMARFLVRSGQRADLAARDARAAGTPGVLRGGLNWYRGFVLSRSAAPSTTNVPVLQVWSDGDVAIRRDTVSAARRNASGRYTFVELVGISHWIPDEAPDALADALLDHFRA